MNLTDILHEMYAYCVYKLINHSKKEIYYGITNDFKERHKEHVANNVVATKMWVFGKDDIQHEIVEKNLTKEDASEKAHNLSERNLIDTMIYNDYETIKTGGW